MGDNIIPFNPLDIRHLGESVGRAMLRQPIVTMKDLRSFGGAGIYSIYYSGDFPTYKVISDCNKDGKFTAPIYIGKAVPAGSRKGGEEHAETGVVLFKRLQDHAKSIEQASNLDLLDFHCRYLITDDIWIPLGESLLIAKFNPIWNKLLDGFGNHNPGRGRHEGLRPRWDTLHPGRVWAAKCKERPETADQIDFEVRDYLRHNPPIILDVFDS